MDDPTTHDIPRIEAPTGPVTNAHVYGALMTLDLKVDLISKQVQPAIDFYKGVLGVLAVARWVGFGGVLLVIGASLVR